MRSNTMNFYIYDEEGTNVAIINETCLTNAYATMIRMGYAGYSIERS